MAVPMPFWPRCFWARRSCWRSPTATGRAPSPGAKCCSISSAAAWRLRPSWPPATGRSVSGKPCARSRGCCGTRCRASSAVGLAQDRQRAQQAPEVRPATRQAAPTGHLDGRDPRGGREGLRLLPRGRWPASTTKRCPPACAKDARRVARLLRLPGRALEAHSLAAPIPSKAPLRPCASGPPRPKGCLSRMTARQPESKAGTSSRPWCITIRCNMAFFTSAPSSVPTPRSSRPAQSKKPPWCVRAGHRPGSVSASVTTRRSAQMLNKLPKSGRATRQAAPSM